MIIENEKLKCMNYPVGVYLQSNLSIIKEYIKIIKSLKKEKIDLICTGSSGAIIAGIISSKINCRVLYVRKEGENSHQQHGDSPYIDSYTIVVDDFVFSGQTIKRILDHYRYTKLNCLLVSGRIYSHDIVFRQEDFDLIICRKWEDTY